MAFETAPGAAVEIAVTRVRIAPLLIGMFVLNAFGYAAITGAVSVLLPTQVREVAGDGAPAALGLITGVAAIAALVMPPLAGVLSDRTRTRWGRRSPFILVAGFASAGALLLLSIGGSIPLLLVGWFLVQACLSVGMNLILATIPERIPAGRHGLASTVQGLGLPIGALIGIQVGAAFVNSIVVGYILLAGLFVVGSVVCAVLLRDGRQLEAVDVPRRNFALEAREMFASLKLRDLRWVFTSRAVMYLGYSMVTAYSLYILQEYIQLPDGLSAAEAVATTGSLGLLATIVATVISGPLVDRFAHHRGFVLASSVTLAGALVVPFIWPTRTAFLFQSLVGGFALGMYLGVDLALATIVLPKTGDAGRDLGVFHIAIMVPQIVAPFITSLIVTFLGGYANVFLFGGIVALCGALAVLRVRRQSLPTAAELRATNAAAKEEVRTAPAS